MAKNSLCQIDRILGPNVLRVRIRLSFGILYSAYIQETLQLKPNWKHNRISIRGRKTNPNCFDHRKICKNLRSTVSLFIHLIVFHYHDTLVSPKNVVMLHSHNHQLEKLFITANITSSNYATFHFVLKHF